MSTPSSDEFAFIVRRMLGRWDHEGLSALQTTRSWADTIKAANYSDDKGGNRWEEDPLTGEVHPVPQDPTGDQAVAPDAVAQMYGKLQKLMREIRSRCADIEHIMDQASHDPKKHPKRPDDKLDEDRWCKSCMTDRGWLEPVAVHPDGRIRYKAECRWCHDYRADTGRPPTLGLLRKRHAGQRITEADILNALAPQSKSA